MTEADWLDHCPRARPDLLVSAAVLRGPSLIHLIKDLRADRAFAVGEKEHFILARLDGRTSLRAIGEDYASRFGRRLDTTGWTRILEQLHTRSFLVVDPVPATATTKAVAKEGTPTGHRRRSTVLSGDVSLAADSTAVIERIHHVVRWALVPRAVVPLVAVIVGMEIVLLRRLGELLELLAVALKNPLTIILLVLTLWLSMAAHEIAHGVVARRFGGIVTALGIRWRLPALYLYCRVDNYLFLRSRWHRVATALGGTYANLLVLVPFCVVWLLWEAPDAVAGYLAGVLVLGSVMGLSNLVPLPPLDGYAVLSHALGVSGLAVESRTFTGLALPRLVGRGPGVAAYPRRARVTYLSYFLGSTALVFALGAAFVLIAAATLPDSWGGWRIAAPLMLVVTALAGSAAPRKSVAGPG